nr:hypothetical protein [Tanacetum cinerariifolium]
MEVYEPEAPLSPVHTPEYPEYLAPSGDDIAPAEDQPLPARAFGLVLVLFGFFCSPLLPALPIALSPGYIADSEPIEDGPEEDPEMDPLDYVAIDDEEESSEGEHLALTDSTLSMPDFVPSAEKTKPLSLMSHPKTGPGRNTCPEA